MSELLMLLQVLKTQGPVVATAIGVGIGVVALVRVAIQTAKEERATREKSRDDLFKALTNQNSQTLVILRDELKMAQDSNNRFFEMMSRNTAALEKLVDQAARQTDELREMRIDINAIESTLHHMDGAIVNISHSNR